MDENPLQSTIAWISHFFILRNSWVAFAVSFGSLTQLCSICLNLKREYSPVYIRFLSGATSWVNTNDSVPQAIHATTLSPFLTDNVLSVMSCSFLSPYFVSLTNLLILLQLLFSSIQRFYFKLDTLLRCFLTFGNDMPSFLRVFLTWLCVAEGFY